MNALHIFSFKRYAGVTLLTGLLSATVIAQVSHPAKLSHKALECAAFDDPSTTITEVDGENILDFTSLKSSDGKFASGMYKAGPQTFDISILKVAQDDFPEIKFYTTSDFKVDALAHDY